MCHCHPPPACRGTAPQGSMRAVTERTVRIAAPAADGTEVDPRPVHSGRTLGRGAPRAPVGYAVYHAMRAPKVPPERQLPTHGFSWAIASPWHFHMIGGVETANQVFQELVRPRHRRVIASTPVGRLPPRTRHRARPSRRQPSGRGQSRRQAPQNRRGSNPASGEPPQGGPSPKPARHQDPTK